MSLVLVITPLKSGAKNYFFINFSAAASFFGDP